jgi:hypothetical protein
MDYQSVCCEHPLPMHYSIAENAVVPKNLAVSRAREIRGKLNGQSVRIKTQGGGTVRLKIKNPQDFWCGILFIALGALAIYLARDYEMGSALRMGPGYFPTWLGGILIGFGVVIGGLAFRIEGEDNQGLGLGEWALRPWLVLTATLALFAVLMEADFGFVPSLIVLIIGCAFAHKDVHWRETLLLSICVTAGAVAIFSYGLGMPYPLFWWSK